MLVKLKNVRLAFPQLFEPKTFGGEGDPAYSASLILAKNNPSIKELEAAIKAVAEEKWTTKAAAELKTLKAAEKLCLRDGDGKSEYDGFPGNVYVAARSKTRPLVIDRDKSPLTSADGRPYGGSICHANVDIWAQSNAYGKRINATLVGVQFVKDGQAFSGAAPASVEDFDSVEEESDDAEGLV